MERAWLQADSRPCGDTNNGRKGTKLRVVVEEKANDASRLIGAKQLGENASDRTSDHVII